MSVLQHRQPLAGIRGADGIVWLGLICLNLQRRSAVYRRGRRSVRIVTKRSLQMAIRRFPAKVAMTAFVIQHTIPTVAWAQRQIPRYHGPHM